MVQLASECDPTYEVEYNLRGQGVSVGAQITNIEWSRVIDDISSATITHLISDENCCDELGRLEPWADTVTVRRNGEVVWYGWIQTVRYAWGQVIVEANDALIWSRVRIPRIPGNGKYDKTLDQVEHFRNFWEFSTSISPLPISLETFPTGLIERRVYNFQELRITWHIFSEMFETGLDITALGSTIYAGVLNHGPSIDLTLRDFEGGDVAITKDGRLFANAVWFNAKEDIMGHYPNDLSFAGDGIYPLVEDVISDAQINSEETAQAAAKARVDFSPKVPRIVTTGDALTLTPRAPVELRQLIPGAIINLDSTGLCYSQVESYRIGRVNVSLTGSRESVSITLLPVGTLAQLQQASTEEV